MNIKDCLDYHRYCIICNAKMVLRSPELIGITIVENNESIHIRTGHVEVGLELFNDGTYVKSKKWADSYSKPLKIQKVCPTCNHNVRLKGRTAGFATLSDKKSKCHIYNFEIMTVSDPFFTKDGTFSCQLVGEMVKFEDNDIMYRVYTDFTNNSSEIIKVTSAKGLGPTWPDITPPPDKTMYMNLPSVRTDKIFNKEQMIDKINTYILFS